jgi:hypothetical protein
LDVLVGHLLELSDHEMVVFRPGPYGFTSVTLPKCVVALCYVLVVWFRT